MKRRILAGCLRKNKAALILFAATAALNGAVFALYGVMTEAFWYAEALLFALLLALLALDFAAECRAAKARAFRRNAVRQLRAAEERHRAAVYPRYFHINTP